MLLFAETDTADEMKQQKRAVWCTEAPEDWDGYGEEWDASNGGIPRPSGLSGRPSLWKMVKRRTIEERRHALATEANKTLSEAKKAVARVRQAGGYYDSTGMKVPRKRQDERQSQGQDAWSLLHMWTA